jgi:transcriptional regulator with XRE-family HTH domain
MSRIEYLTYSHVKQMIRKTSAVQEDWAVKEFGARLKEARLSKQLSQRQLADACGWTTPGGQARIMHYEKGRNEPGLKDIVTLARALGVLPWILAFGGGETLAELMRALTPTPTTMDESRRAEHETATTPSRKKRGKKP